jgi:heat shock protein HslJ
MYLTQNSGGSGTFFYVVVAVNVDGTYTGTNAMFLGDRIAPQNINIIKGNAVANFAQRKMGEPFTAAPSVGKSVYIHLDPKSYEIGELVQNFEGEADPSKMTLGMKVWTWVRTEYSDGKKVSPKKVDAFTLTFNKDGTLSVKTDCNNMGGSYTVKGGALSFSNMVSTLMFCDGSQEGEFSAMLSAVTNYRFTSKGELILDLKAGEGTVILR